MAPKCRAMWLEREDESTMFVHGYVQEMKTTQFGLSVMKMVQNVIALKRQWGMVSHYKEAYEEPMEISLLRPLLTSEDGRA